MPGASGSLRGDAIAPVILLALFAAVILFGAPSETRNADAGTLTCAPDLVNFTPTPTLGWDVPVAGWAPENGGHGYRVYAGVPGGVLTLAEAIPCEERWIEDEFGGIVGSYFWCRAYSVPQRYRPDELDVVEFRVAAYNDLGEGELSNAVTICMPEVYDGPPAPYE